MNRPSFAQCLSLATVLCFAASASANTDTLNDALATVRTASPIEGSTEAMREAWKILAASDAGDLPTLLRGMNDCNPAVENWILAAVDQVASRTLASGDSLPTAELVELVRNTDDSPRARRSAYELLESVAPVEAAELLSGLTDDPSLELRYDAIAAGLKATGELEGDEAREAYAKLFDSARDLDQIKECKAELEDLGQEIDLAKHMGFITSWRVIGVFDNTDKSGFDVAYPPENEIDFGAEYTGKTETASWRPEPVATDDELGEVDLNDAIGPKKGAIVYAYAQVSVPKAQTAQLRYASSNATKLWINGRLVASNEVYHAGGGVDQYSSDANLKAGANTILLKVCQNEQTEPWAQDWSFQLRICDLLGGGATFETNSESQP